ncbi:MAG: Metal-dependent hydrolase of the beta-lactamase superfamily [Candidatus Methanohalarchaeum thermophilum]|uniref:Metal-dependent hydrolase of the beta-lactamase superfamily n=1 Tax=Methanohalarchaeum thermophilum TaxID=1903181 RepID=A0A1Q6DV95_METT1|nr:MAG: Metal-dependent hydrolase of the beta-lactamase superfamily [Candidatus Methanohalarchaeum thermophilum]
MKIHFLGTSWAVPSKDRSGTSIYLENHGTLLDCGGDVAQKLIKMEKDPLDIEKIFLTHEHLDHLYGLPSLLQVIKLLGNKKEVSIFGPTDTIEKIKKVTSLFGLEEDLKLNYTSLDNREKEEQRVRGEIEGFRYTKVKHSKPTLAYRKNKVTFSGDTSYSEELIDLAKNSQLLIHEATFKDSERKKAKEKGHSTPKEAIKTGLKSNVDKIALVHTNSQLDSDELNKKYKSIDILAPNDLETIEI